jgi:hypothetical protein
LDGDHWEGFLENKNAAMWPRLWNEGKKFAARQCATAWRAPRVKSNETVVRGVITRRAFPILED